jgi:hypothetical protein
MGQKRTMPDRGKYDKSWKPQPEVGQRPPTPAPTPRRRQLGTWASPYAARRRFLAPGRQAWNVDFENVLIREELVYRSTKVATRLEHQTAHLGQINADHLDYHGTADSIFSAHHTRGWYIKLSNLDPTAANYVRLPKQSSSGERRNRPRSGV